jgi:serine/threonine protein kinase
MEYLPGGSLERYLQKNPLHDPNTGYEKETVWYFLYDLLKGLDYMHSKNIVHLDLKPSNMMLSPRSGTNIPTLKIGDFGLSRLIDGSESPSERFKKGDGRYLAPELLDSTASITTAADIFSLGISVYEMATDYKASEALWNDVINNHLKYDKISKDLKPLIARMVGKDPSFRSSAGHCLLTNDKLQKLAKENGLESFREEYSNEDMEESSVEYFPNQIDINEVSKPSLDVIRKKLF